MSLSTQTNKNLSRSQTNIKKNKPWKWVVTALVIAILGIASYYIYSIFNFAQDIQVEPKPDSTKQEALPEWTGKDRVNILLLGVDKREELDSTRSDSILLLSLDPETKQTHVFSIMRDTWVPIPDHRTQKINAAFALGGAPLAAKTVEQFLDIPVQYYVTTDLNGFEHIVDSIGGIDLNVEHDMVWKTKAEPEYDIDLKAGQQHLSGREALGYVRFRHDAQGDYGRSERQRTFLKAVAEKVQSTTGIIKIPGMLKAAAPYIETNMSTKDMLKIANLAYKSDTNNMQSIQLPPEQFAEIGYSSDGQWRILPDIDGIRNYIYETLNIDGTPAVAGKNKESSSSTSSKETNSNTSKATEAAPKPTPAPAPAPTPQPAQQQTDTNAGSGTGTSTEAGGTDTNAQTPSTGGNNQTPTDSSTPAEGTNGATTPSTGSNSGTSTNQQQTGGSSQPADNSGAGTTTESSQPASGQ